MSPLLQRIETDLKEAMKSRSELKLSALRLLKSELQYEMNKTGEKELSDSQIQQLIQRSIKKRKDSISQFQKAGRDELARKEQEEVEILEVYLPAPVSQSEIEAVIEQAIQEIQPSSPSDMGKIMSRVMGSFKGQNIDGALVKTLVQARLQH